MTTSTANTAPFRERLHARFCERSLPLVHSDGVAIPAASLWTGSRLWVRHLRSLGIESGGRIWLDLAPCPAVIQVLLAAWWLECDAVIGKSDGVVRLEGRGGHALPTWGGSPCDCVVRCAESAGHSWPMGVSGPAAEGDRPTWRARPAAHPPWLLDVETARAALSVEGEQDRGEVASIPAAWTDREVLLGRVLPALANGSILCEEGWPLPTASA